MDWQDTLFLIRQMAWGETLIWTSSASKKMALPGWAQRPWTATHMQLHHSYSSFTLASRHVCMCVYFFFQKCWGPVEMLLPIIHLYIYYCVFFPSGILIMLRFIFLPPHYLCFMLHSWHFQKGITEAGSRLTKRWIKVCASALFGQVFVVCLPLPPFFSLYMPRTSLLLALSTLFLFTDFVYSNAMCMTFQFSPYLGPGIALTLWKTLAAIADAEVRHEVLQFQFPVMW